MSTRELQSTIKAMVAKKGVVETAKKVGVTTVSLQAFLHGSEVYAKTLAKMQKAAGVEITAIPAKEKFKQLAEEKRAARKARKAAKVEKAKAKAAARAAKKSGKPVKAKAKAGKTKVKRAAPPGRKIRGATKRKKALKAAPKRKKTKLAKKKHARSNGSTNGVAHPNVAPTAQDEAVEALDEEQEVA
jgi:hypothetical protein